MYQKLLFCVYMTAFSSTTTIFKAKKLSLKDSFIRLVLCNVSLLMFLFVIIAKLFLIARAAARVALVIFGHSILFRVHEAVHVISNLRLEVCDNSASCGVAEMVSLQELCNVCRISIKKQFGNFVNVDAPFRDGKPGKEDTEDISEDHYLAGFRHKYYTLAGRCFQTISFFLYSIVDSFLFFFFSC